MSSSPLTDSPIQARSPVVLGGPSGVGKTHLVAQLTARQPDLLRRPTSVTSRPRRPGEDDSEYEFRSQESILAMASKGELLNLDRVYGDYYGVTLQSIQDLLSAGFIPIKEIHPSNFWKFSSRYSRTLTLMLLYSPDSHCPPPGTSARNRRTEDDDFYCTPGVLSLADLTLYRTRFASDLPLVRHIENCIHAHLRYSDFPRPLEIDCSNQEGYKAVAPEFTDARRLTTANFHQLTAPYFERAIRTLHPESRCLEIGPGRGWLRKSFSSWPPGTDYHSLELVAEMNDANTDARLGTVRMLPYPTEFFDTVLSSLGDPYCYPLALCEIRRVLREDGTFIFSAPSASWSHALRAPESSHRTSFVLSNGEQATVYSFTFELPDLVDLFSTCGFEVNEARELSIGQELLHPLSEAITSAARSLSVSYRELPIINFVRARATA